MYGVDEMDGETERPERGTEMQNHDRTMGGQNDENQERPARFRNVGLVPAMARGGRASSCSSFSSCQKIRTTKTGRFSTRRSAPLYCGESMLTRCSS